MYGVPQGYGTACLQVACPLHACCLPSGICTYAEPIDCDFLNGAYIGGTCEPSPCANSAPAVSNVTASQRQDGSKIVDIYYRLDDADGDDCMITLQASSDGGATWTVPITAVSGHVGPGVLPYVNRHIVWDCAVDLPGAFGSQHRVRVRADDGHNPLPFGMNSVPGGTIQMGDPWHEGGTQEQPVHWVYLSSFALDPYEVTNTQYAAALNWARGQGDQISISAGRVYKYNSGTTYPYCDTASSAAYAGITWNGSTFVPVAGQEQHPVVRVSWYGAVAYCNWRGALDGRPSCYDLSTWACDFGVAGYRLPTEAEWEKAAAWDPSSSGRHYRYAEHTDGCGTICLDGHRANYLGSDDPFESGHTPVGYYNGSTYGTYVTQDAQSYYGCYDMSGNVYEWCYDWYSGSYYSVSSEVNPTGPASGSLRVIRGGGWNSSVNACRSAFRNSRQVDFRNYDLGFRCAVGVPGDVGSADSPSFTIYNPLNVTVTASAAYNATTKLLNITAFAFDHNSGQYVTTGTGTWSMQAPVASGPLSYTQGAWRGSQSFSSNPLPAGTYLVTVGVGSGSTTVSFAVAGGTGSIGGTVRNTAGAVLPGATIRVYDSVLYYAGGAVPITQATTGANGTYLVNNLAPGWYVVNASATGYIASHATVQVTPSASAMVNFALSPFVNLEQLITPMQELYHATQAAMMVETYWMPDMTEQAADHFTMQLDALDAASIMVSILGGVDYDPAAMGWILREASRPTYDLFFRTVGRHFLGQTVNPLGAKLLISTYARALIPIEGSGWRRFEYNEFTQFSPYTAGSAALEDSHIQFEATAGTVPVAANFSMAAATRAIRAQTSLARGVAYSDAVTFLPLPDPADGATWVILPVGRQKWLQEHAWLSVLGGGRRTLTGIKVASGVAAVGATMTGVGAGVGAVCGAVSTVTGAAASVVAWSEMPVRFAAAHTYAELIKGWAADMLSLPVVHTETVQFLHDQAAAPTYLASQNTYTAIVDVNLNAPFGGNVIFTNLASYFADEEATVTITNIGNAPSEFRVIASGWWNYHLPTGVPLLLLLFGGVSEIDVPVCRTGVYGTPDLLLQPGEARVVGIPYTGVLIDIVNAFSPHILQVDVYSGPFKVKTVRKDYFVAPGLSLAGMALRSERDSITDLLPQVTTLFDGDLSAAAPEFEAAYSVGVQSRSAAFKLLGPEGSALSLRVCDGVECVGYDAVSGTTELGFPASVSGAGTRSLTVDVPNASGRTFNIIATLSGADTSDGYPVTLLALETPIRPAVLGVTPTEFGTTAYNGQAASLVLNVGEAGGQLPLGNVTVTLGPLTGPDGATTLPPTTPTTIELVSIGAGRAQDVSFTFDVPLEQPNGAYSGVVDIVAPGVGAVSVPVTVTVLRRGDANYDGTLSLADFAGLQTCFGKASVSVECAVFDIDGSSAVNVTDVEAFEFDMLGPPQ